jgi:hypothetical protein
MKIQSHFRYLEQASWGSSLKIAPFPRPPTLPFWCPYFPLQTRWMSKSAESGQKRSTAEMRPESPCTSTWWTPFLSSSSYSHRESSSSAGHAWSPSHRATTFWSCISQLSVSELIRWSSQERAERDKNKRVTRKGLRYVQDFGLSERKVRAQSLNESDEGKKHLTR